MNEQVPTGKFFSIPSECVNLRYRIVCVRNEGQAHNCYNYCIVYQIVACDLSFFLKKKQ
jgi:hypothetical protein